MLVTGAGGFVGSALCRALSHEGHEVIGLTRDVERTRKRAGASSGLVTLVQGSIALPAAIASAAQSCEVVFHAAGLGPRRAPAKVLRWVHVAGTENVLRAARHAGVKRVVHMSCADVTLHDGERMHWDEKRALPSLPTGPHARTKLMAEELALAASDERLEVTALRPAFLWGAGDVDGVSALALEARKGGVALYDGGRNIIATTHIDNLLEAAKLAAEAPLAPARAYYVTDGEFLEAREFYGRLLEALALPAPRRAGSLALELLRNRALGYLGRDRDGSARAALLRRGQSALFDLSQASADLGYRPTVELGSACAKLAAWARSQGGIDALIEQAAPEPNESDVAEQVLAAGGD